MHKNPARRDISCKMLFIPSTSWVSKEHCALQAKMKVNKGNGHSPVVRHSWYSAAKNCFAFTAVCRWECAEGSSCGDCKRDQSRSLAASTNQNFQCAAMKRMRDAIRIRLSALSHLGAVAQTRPQDSTSCIFSSDS